ncbi:MAG: dienelactone hydrolase family protein [Saprospiraceae bacterium]
MENKKINPEIFDLYDDYAHNKMNRREFIDKLGMYAIGGLTIPSLLSYILPNYDNPDVLPDDVRIKVKTINYDSPKGGGTITGQLARPKGMGRKLPGIIVVHENRGLNPYIEDVGRRAAVEGFISIAPDALSPLGGYPGNDDEGRAMQKKRDKSEMLEDFIAAFNYLKEHPRCDGNIGVVGFCFGGWISNMMAVKVPELNAAVPFYGGQPKAEDVPQINTPLLLQFAELDKRVNKGFPAYEAALKEHNKAYKAHFYPNAKHGFHNNTTPRYDKNAAKLAWERTIEFFNKNLKK